MFLQVTRRRRPRVVFEFGSGYSTLVLAEALRRNSKEKQPVYLYSFETKPSWAERTRHGITDGLESVCEIRDCGVEVCTLEGDKAYVHTNVPDVVPDMIYLDGPGCGGADIQGAADILRLEKKLPERFLLIVDGRKQTARFLSRHLKRTFAYSEARGIFNRAYRLRFFDFANGETRDT